MAAVLKVPEDPFKQEEEDLFEIDLEAVEKSPPPQYYWEDNGVLLVKASQPTFAATLFANCLLPASDVTGAVPIPAMADSGKLCVGRRSLSMLAMSSDWIGSQPLAMTLGKLLELPFPGTELRGGSRRFIM